MKKLLQTLKQYWAVVAIVASVAANIAMAAYATGNKAGSADVEFTQLKAKVEANNAADTLDHANLKTHLATMEQKTESVPEQLRNIQTRLATLEGKSDLILKMLDTRLGYTPQMDSVTVTAAK